MKKKVRVFLSFEFGRDNELHHNFYTQAVLYSQYEIIDYSLNKEYHPNLKWLNKARAQIKKSDLVIVMLGQDMHNAPGVEKEEGRLISLRNPCFKFARSDEHIAGSAVQVKWFHGNGSGLTR